MKSIFTLLVVAVAHLGFLGIEMYPWDRPHVFEVVELKFEPKEAHEKVAAAIVHYAGLSNGFVAAGAFGACTLTYKTLLLQTLPGVVALVAVWATRSPEDHS